MPGSAERRDSDASQPLSTSRAAIIAQVDREAAVRPAPDRIATRDSGAAAYGPLPLPAPAGPAPATTADQQNDQQNDKKRRGSHGFLLFVQHDPGHPRVRQTDKLTRHRAAEM